MYFGTWSRLTWFLPPHSPVGGFATELYAAHYCHSRTAFDSECRTTGLTSKPHHAHGNFAPLMWIVSPATGIDFQPQTRLPCRPYYTAVPIGWQYVFPAKNNICVVFFRMSRRFRSKRKFILCFLRNYFEFAGSAPYAHKCGAPCFELYFRKDAFSSFSVLFPICRILQKLHPQACKTRKLFGSGLPEVLSLSAKHSDYKSAKIGCQTLRRTKFRQFYENTLKNLRIRGKLWNTDKTNAVFKPVARFSAGRIRPMQCRCAVRCAA